MAKPYRFIRLTLRSDSHTPSLLFPNSNNPADLLQASTPWSSGHELQARASGGNTIQTYKVLPVGRVTVVPDWLGFKSYFFDMAKPYRFIRFTLRSDSHTPSLLFPNSNNPADLLQASTPWSSGHELQARASGVTYFFSKVSLLFFMSLLGLKFELLPCRLGVIFLLIQ